MVAFFESCHVHVLDVVENWNHILYDKEVNEIPMSRWIDEQKQRYLLNCKAEKSSCVLSLNKNIQSSTTSKMSNRCRTLLL